MRVGRVFHITAGVAVVAAIDFSSARPSPFAIASSFMHLRPPRSSVSSLLLVEADALLNEARFARILFDSPAA